MTYEIWNLETGNIVTALDSEDEAYAGVRSAVDSGRVDPGFVGLIVADDAGHVVEKHEGDDLLSLARGAAAA